MLCTCVCFNILKSCLDNSSDLNIDARSAGGNFYDVCLADPKYWMAVLLNWDAVYDFYMVALIHEMTEYVPNSAIWYVLRKKHYMFSYNIIIWLVNLSIMNWWRLWMIFKDCLADYRCWLVDLFDWVFNGNITDSRSYLAVVFELSKPLRVLLLLYMKLVVRLLISMKFA